VPLLRSSNPIRSFRLPIFRSYGAQILYVRFGYPHFAPTELVFVANCFCNCCVKKEKVRRNHAHFFFLLDGRLSRKSIDDHASHFHRHVREESRSEFRLSRRPLGFKLEEGMSVYRLCRDDIAGLIYQNLNIDASR